MAAALAEGRCHLQIMCNTLYIDYFMVGECIRFLFTSFEESQTNERVFEQVSL